MYWLKLLRVRSVCPVPLVQTWEYAASADVPNNKRIAAPAINLLCPLRAVMGHAENDEEFNKALLRYIYSHHLHIYSYLREQWFIWVIDIVVLVIGAESAPESTSASLQHYATGKYDYEYFEFVTSVQLMTRWAEHWGTNVVKLSLKSLQEKISIKHQGGIESTWSIGRCHLEWFMNICFLPYATATWAIVTKFKLSVFIAGHPNGRHRHKARAKKYIIMMKKYEKQTNQQLTDSHR